MTTRLLALLPLVALVGCRGAEPGDRGDPVPPGSDLERLQGMWEIVDFQTARPGDGPNPEKQQAIRLAFAGDKLTITVGSPTDWKEQFTVSLNASADPRQMTLVELTGPSAPKATAARTGEPERSEWIYKFEGDTLVIAVADPGAPRPTDFSPRGVRGAGGTAPATATGYRVDVVRLRKTNYPASAGPRFGTAAGYGTYRYGSSGGYRYSTYPSSGTYRGGTYPYRGTAISPKTTK